MPLVIKIYSSNQYILHPLSWFSVASFSFYFGVQEPRNYGRNTLAVAYVLTTGLNFTLDSYLRSELPPILVPYRCAPSYRMLTPTGRATPTSLYMFGPSKTQERHQCACLAGAPSSIARRRVRVANGENLLTRVS